MWCVCFFFAKNRFAVLLDASWIFIFVLFLFFSFSFAQPFAFPVNKMLLYCINDEFCVRSNKSRFNKNKRKVISFVSPIRTMCCRIIFCVFVFLVFYIAATAVVVATPLTRSP